MDLISRQAAIAAITDEKFAIIPQLNPLYDGLRFMSKMSDYNEVCDIVVDILKKLPSAQRWIPVTEKLPDKPQWVIATVDWDGIRQTSIWWYSSAHNFNVVAWMPLPEPYKECTNNALKEQSNALDALENGEE